MRTEILNQVARLDLLVLVDYYYYLATNLLPGTASLVAESIQNQESNSLRPTTQFFITGESERSIASGARTFTILRY